MKPIAWVAAAALGWAAAPLAAHPAGALALAIQAGQVGERFDGYMGFVSAPSPEVRRQVAAINLRRRNLYIELAGRRNVSPAVVGIATGCQLLRQLVPGETYMLTDGAWRRWSPGQPLPVPQQCG
jgi:uncharacterized protein YdbL (DUF1318 family)